MNRPNEMKILLSAFLLAFMGSPLLAPRTIASLSGTVIRVPYDFPTIQEAVDAATAGSVIVVSGGTYSGNINIAKSLWLVGEDRMTTFIEGGIVVTADNVLINGFTIRNGDRGIELEQVNNCTISGNTVTQQRGTGIRALSSNNSFILSNTITLCGSNSYGPGIALQVSFNNVVNGNIIAGNRDGLDIDAALEGDTSMYNLICNNVIAGTVKWGIYLYHSIDNVIHHNSFINNSQNLELVGPNGNTWDDGSEGNYWDSYVGLDDGNGGRIACDGVGDTNLPSFSVDSRPLISPCGPVPVVVDNATYLFGLSSNSTVSYPRFSQADKKITFNVSGPAGTTGHCTIQVPNSLLRSEPWTVLLNSTDVTSQATITTNQTHATISLNYNHSNTKVRIVGTWVVPEFPSTAFMVALIFAVLPMVLLRRFRKNVVR